MRKTILVVMTAITLVVITSCMIFAQTKSPAGQSAIQAVTALEQEWCQKSTQSNIPWHERHLADSYIGTDANGAVSDKALMIAGVKSKVAKTDSTYEGLKVQAYGDAAVATSIEVIKKGTYKGRDAVGKYRWTDTWVKLNGQWQCVASHCSRIASN